MNSVELLIYPPIKLPPQSSSKIQIIIRDIKIFEYVRLIVNLLDIDDKIIDTRLYLLQGDDYNNWGTDDNYLVNWVKTKLQNESQN